MRYFVKTLWAGLLLFITVVNTVPGMGNQGIFWSQWSMGEAIAAAPSNSVNGSSYNYMEVIYHDLSGDFIEYGSMSIGQPGTSFQAIGSFTAGNTDQGPAASGTMPTVFTSNGEILMGGFMRYNFSPDGEFAAAYKIESRTQADSHFVFLTKKSAIPSTPASLAGTYNTVGISRFFDGVNFATNTTFSGQYVFNPNGTYQFTGNETVSAGSPSPAITPVRSFVVDPASGVVTLNNGTGFVMFSANGQYALYFAAISGTNEIGLLIKDPGVGAIPINVSSGRYIELSSEGVSETGQQPVDATGLSRPVIERQWDQFSQAGGFICGVPSALACTTTLRPTQITSQTHGLLQFTQSTTNRLTSGYISADAGVFIHELSGSGFDVRVAAPVLPQMSLTLNAPSYTTGSRLILTRTMVASSLISSADIYLALMLPDGTLLIRQPNGSFSTAITPLQTDTVVPTATDIVFNYTFTGQEPTGTYTWLAALMQAGTLHVIGTMASQNFTFIP